MIFWETLEQIVFNRLSKDDLFNPYRDRHPDLDRSNAADIRRNNLRAYLDDHSRGAPLLLIAEAPGPWGCRFSGVPITSERQLLDPSFPASGDQSSTRKEPFSEYSAGIFWRRLQPFYRQFVVWNTVPMHPHRPNEPLSIRTPLQSEIEDFLPVLEAVHKWTSPELTLAIGRKAQNALGRIGVSASYVRHPSQGGAILFDHGVLKAIKQLGLVADTQA